jgi:hypothetical protein
MNSLTRWKLVTGVLLGLSMFSTYRWYGAENARAAAQPAELDRDRAPATTSPSRRGTTQAANLEERVLIERLRSAKTARELTRIAHELGSVGTDLAVDALATLLTDTRPGVPQAALAAMGQIGTPAAVHRLIDASKAPSSGVRYAAVAALGASDHRLARERLAEIARGHERHLASAAVHALGELGGREAVAILGELAETA